MKRIYLFGRIVRVSFLISFMFLLYAFVEMYIQNNFKFTNLLLLILIVCVVIYGFIWIYSFGLFIDKKNNKLKVIIGFSKSNKIYRSLCEINSLDVELNEDISMNFIINYKNGCVEKINYKFYRISFLEKAQYKRLKKSCKSLKIIVK